jgi:general secretion pathway protein G
MYFLNHRQSRRGTAESRGAFTLVELMVVLVIVALLSGVVTLSVRGYLLKSKQNIAKLEISKLIQGLDTFYANFDRYPSNEEGLEILAAKTDDFPGGILSFVPKDPWNFPYAYRCPGATEPYEIVCFGSDHRDGGDGGDRDITSMAIARGSKTP